MEDSKLSKRRIWTRSSELRFARCAANSFHCGGVTAGVFAGTLALTFVLWGLIPRAEAQRDSETPTEEIVANLAAGRVVIAVVKDAIIIGTVENPIEAETRIPTPVQLTSVRAGVILGSVDWFSPSTNQDLARLDTELPHLRSRELPDNAPHLQANVAGSEATDIETTGQGLLERLDGVAKGLHGKVDLPADEPIAELIIADFLTGYGPEVWQLSYEIKQVEERRDYWVTRVVRPVYLQSWPPEKGQPHTLIEFDYPPENAPTSLLELLRQKDPRLEKLRSSDATMAHVADLFLQGDSTKILPNDAGQFLRAALNAIAPAQSRQTMAAIAQETGFQWILQPPAEAPKPQQQAQEQPQQKQERPADAPSLLRPPASH